MEIIQTPFFTIYRYQDRVEIFNEWDVYKEYGLVLQNEAQIKELMLICQILTLAKNAFEFSKMFVISEIDNKK